MAIMLPERREITELELGDPCPLCVRVAVNRGDTAAMLPELCAHDCGSPNRCGWLTCPDCDATFDPSSGRLDGGPAELGLARGQE